MRITWAIEGKGSGEATAGDADDAAAKLASAVRNAYADLDTQTLAHVMLSAVAPIRAQLVREGAQSVAQGREWSVSMSGIFVTLYPN